MITYENVILFVLVFANIVTGLSFFFATTMVSRSTGLGYLWETVILRACAVLVYLSITYDFFRQAYYIVTESGVVYSTASWHYIATRVVLALTLPVALWISYHLNNQKIVTPAVESYVEKLIRETEEEEARRKTYDTDAKTEVTRRDNFNETVLEEGPRREAYDIAAGKEAARRELADNPAPVVQGKEQQPPKL